MKQVEKIDSEVELDLESYIKNNRYKFYIKMLIFSVYRSLRTLFKLFFDVLRETGWWFLNNNKNEKIKWK